MKDNYRTASNLEDLDIIDEIHSYDSVGHAVENHNIWEEEYKDADIFILMMDYSEKDEIINMLKSTGYSAYLEFESEEDEDGYSGIEIIKVL